MFQFYQKWFGKSLAEELAEVLDSVAELKKLGENTEDADDPYNYLRIVDICNAFRGELLQRGILFTPTDEDVTYETLGDFERCTIRTSFALIRKSDRLELGVSSGMAKSRSDKALAIAQTMAFKAMLKRISMIYGTEDDPEANRETLTPRESVKAATYQRRAWKSAVHESGATSEAISTELSKIMGFPIDADQIPDLPRENFEIAMKWLLSENRRNSQDLTQSWSAAVTDIKTKRGPQPIVSIMDRKATDEIA